MKVLVTGGSGFVGGNVVRELVRREHQVVCLVRPASRGAERVRDLGAEVVPGDIITPEGLAGVPQVDAAVHLVGVIREHKGNTFRRVHADGTRFVLDAAKRAGAKRFVHMSALGTRADAVSDYHKSKWEGEQAVRSGRIPWTIFRPSIVFGRDAWGEDCEFVRQMLDLHGKVLGLFTPVAGSGESKMQPVWVGDVARFFADALENPEMENRAYDLGGPEAYPFQEIQDILCRARYGKVKPHLHLPLWCMKCLAFLAELLLSKPPVTRDQLKMVPEGSTCDVSQILEVSPGKLFDFEIWVAQNLKP